MTIEIPERKMLVALPANMVGALLQMNASLNAGLADSLQSFLIAASTNEPAQREKEPHARANSMPQAGRYSAEFLGAPLAASTLPEIFTQFVDWMEEIAPEALLGLAAIRARTRRFVARTPEAIHPGRPDLAVVKTSSGWWISKNIGQDDLKRALRALAQAAGLRFGEDIKFPSVLGS